MELLVRLVAAIIVLSIGVSSLGRCEERYGASYERWDTAQKAVGLGSLGLVILAIVALVGLALGLT